MEKTYKLVGYEEDRDSEWNLQWHSSEHEKHERAEKSTRHGLERFCSCGLEQRIDCGFLEVHVKTPEPEIKVINPEKVDMEGSGGGSAPIGSKMGGAGSRTTEMGQGEAVSHYDRQQWQYKTLPTEHASEDIVNAYGERGWELIGLTNARLFFKRPKQ